MGAPKMIDKLPRELNVAARVVCNTRKYDRSLSRFRRDKLHWLDVDDRVKFRMCVQVFKCLHNMAPAGYWTSLCQPVSRVCRIFDQLVEARWTTRVSTSRRTPLQELGTHYLTIFKDTNISSPTFTRHLHTFFFSY